MKVLALLILLTGCDPEPQYKCIDGALYTRFVGDQSWKGVDAAPSHTGFTPTPCKPADGAS